MYTHTVQPELSLRSQQVFRIQTRGLPEKVNVPVGHLNRHCLFFSTVSSEIFYPFLSPPWGYFRLTVQKICTVYCLFAPFSLFIIARVLEYALNNKSYFD